MGDVMEKVILMKLKKDKKAYKVIWKYKDASIRLWSVHTNYIDAWIEALQQARHLHVPLLIDKSAMEGKS